MSVLIKGIEMPKDCPMCPCAHWNKNDIMTGCEIVWRYVPDSETDYWQSDKRPDWCPLVDVPTPHGRLIDADAVLSQYNGNILTAQNDYAEGLRDAAEDIKTAPTIIEAEEGVTEACWLWGADVRCSGCGYKLQTTGLPQYCPNCGARMKG